MSPTLRQSFIAECVRRYPLLSGSGSLANSAMVRRLAGFKVGLTWARHRNGMRMRVSLDDFNGRAVFYAGDVDRKLTWLCNRIVRPGDTTVDVGANIGLVTLTLAGLVGSKGRVWSFEPNPALVGLINESLAENGLQHVVVVQCAVGAEDGELLLSIPKGHSGRGSLVRTRNGEASKQITVPVRTLSNLIPTDVTDIRLMKIDVEGFEAQVLDGAKALFDRSPPDAVLFEVNELKGTASDEPSIQFLRDVGYVFMAIPKSYLRMKIHWYNPDHDPLPGHDVLAVRRGGVADEIGQRVRVRGHRRL